MKRFVLFLFLVISVNFLLAEVRGIWATSWDIESKEKIDSLIEDTAANNFNTILAEVRYRGDALYIPNKKNNKYKNNEPQSYILSEDFDALQYLIKKAQRYDIRVYAWITTFVITPHSLKNIDNEHVYFQHPEWITYDNQGNKMATNATEGAYLDPGIPAVQDYMINLVMDIVSNYDIDGIQFDYIRYPGAKYGNNSISQRIYRKEKKEEMISWENWKEKQITRFIKRAYAEIKSIKPEVEVTAAVIADLRRARNNYSQNWVKWVREGYLDSAYLMAYSKSNSAFKQRLKNVIIHGIEDKVVVGVRAWNDTGSYPAKKVTDKIDIAKSFDVKGIACFHYEGMVKHQYFEPIKKKNFKKEKRYDYRFNRDEKYIYGYVYGENNRPLADAEIKIISDGISTKTDANGFYFLPQLPKNIYEMQIKFANNILFQKKINLRRNRSYNHKQDLRLAELVINDFQIQCRANAIDDGILLSWEIENFEPVSIYRKTSYFSDFPTRFEQELVHIELDSVTTWIDKDLPTNAEFQYQLIGQSGVESNLTFATHPLESKPIDVLVNSYDENNVQFSFHLEESSRLKWRLLDSKGNDIIQKNSWYDKGETVEIWNGISEMGYAVKSGFYTLFCFSETWMESYRITVYINREG